MITEALALRLVTDEMWAVVEPLIPRSVPRQQGGGRVRIDDRSALTALALFLTLDQAWKWTDSSTFGVTSPTLYRRFKEYSEVGVWQALRVYGQHVGDPWPRNLAEAAFQRAKLDAEQPWKPRRRTKSSR